MRHPFSVSHAICDATGWSISNLQLQKILYFCQTMWIGERGLDSPLISSTFQAWDYGPVVPEVYHQASCFGDSSVGDVFNGYQLADDSPAKPLVVKVATNLQKYTGGQLVAYTHDEIGAWAKHYKPNKRGIIIPNSDILTEYNDRKEKFSRRS